jgi:molybdate transport system regulatory protein
MWRTRPPRRLGVKAKFWLTLGPHTLFGDGKADLLEAVDRLGSLRSAARSLYMSYRYAWGLLRELDAAAAFPFLEHSGTGPRTNLRLTEKGRRFIEDYRRFRAPLDSMVKHAFRRTFRRSPGPSRRSP